MKALLAAILFASLHSLSASAATSVCEVFEAMDANNGNDEIVTTCDGVQQTATDVDPDKGSVVALTNAMHALVAKGYVLVNCDNSSSGQSCFLQK